MKKMNLRIFSVEGKIGLQAEIQAVKRKLSLNHSLTPGIYIIEMSNSKISISKKFSVK